jgi:hypothetical protein
MFKVISAPLGRESLAWSEENLANWLSAPLGIHPWRNQSELFVWFYNSAQTIKIKWVLDLKGMNFEDTAEEPNYVRAVKGELDVRERIR